ncbi:hypothetical protein BN77_2794 [Rhizobium mesoamericanum STM3625]|uniref:Uncharacterized protein n=1 Tax=Rhizobium mesoamericanum STM3625 TaxID=1211777 RepID=K0PVQ1_9HYPH|nr:hypothetical protein BN77_2794 [Rhizobium mesoamericanum STM3625]
MMTFVNTHHEIDDTRIGTNAFCTNAECILVELIPTLSLMAAIADDGFVVGKPGWGQDLDNRTFSRTIGRFWHDNLPEFL